LLRNKLDKFREISRSDFGNPILNFNAKSQKREEKQKEKTFLKFGTAKIKKILFFAPLR